MPEIPVGAQIFDVVFHPTAAITYTGLLTGRIKAFAYGEQGDSNNLWTIRPSKRSCRGLALNEDGSKLYAVGKSKDLYTIDTATADIDTRSGAHDCAINRVKSLMPWTLATGDDDGTVKLWDPRKRDAVKSYTQHFDYITDFLWLGDKRQLVATRHVHGDGTLSVMDIRVKKAEVLAQSEDQEDELLSIVAIKKNQKFLVGTQLGMISVFNRKKGWADCVDRIPGHPLSIDALCNIPEGIPDSDATSTVLTGSSDGFVRVVKILPTKFVGVLADHGDFPVERIAVGGGVGHLTPSAEAPQPPTSKVGADLDADQDAEMEDDLSKPRRWWVGSVGHDETLRLTDLGAFFHENTTKSPEDSDEEDSDEEWTGIVSMVAHHDEARQAAEASKGALFHTKRQITDDTDSEEDDADEAMLETGSQPSKRKRQSEKDSSEPKKPKKGKKESVVDKAFFDGL
ncbi:WD40 repeat-like protein [Coprinopsis marcescibilis]|uniref:WD repeat-containing protein JIP5 n=1 Tax=Coprinopsis marcescibilis TaxID=230819 RepID=A0A5C3LAD3_COPMA|nr:WD40 repeat-like protein [Coprinopsis marcescibilis]